MPGNFSYEETMSVAETFADIAKALKRWVQYATESPMQLKAWGFDSQARRPMPAWDLCDCQTECAVDAMLNRIENGVNHGRECRWNHWLRGLDGLERWLRDFRFRRNTHWLRTNRCRLLEIGKACFGGTEEWLQSFNNDLKSLFLELE